MAERHGQRWFTRAASWGLVLLCTLPLAADRRTKGPDRTAMAPRVASVRFDRIESDVDIQAGLRLTGAWRVRVGDSRFAGLSALAVSPDGLLALADSGWLIDLPRPGEGATARLRDLPAGPGPPNFKKNRDSEALAADPTGWWVTFEFRHSLWHFAPDWRSGREVASFRHLGWRVNTGVEAIVRLDDGRLLLISESGRFVLEGTPGRGFERRSLTGATGGVADAARLPDGRIVVAVREVGWGLVNRLAWLERSGRGYRLRPFATVQLGPFDNIEGLAAEPLPGGGTRLWAVTDNDGWRRNLLLEMELPASGARNAAKR